MILEMLLTLIDGVMIFFSPSMAAYQASHRFVQFIPRPPNHSVLGEGMDSLKKI